MCVCTVQPQALRLSWMPATTSNYSSSHSTVREIPCVYSPLSLFLLSSRRETERDKRVTAQPPAGTLLVRPWSKQQQQTNYYQLLLVLHRSRQFHLTFLLSKFLFLFFFVWLTHAALRRAEFIHPSIARHHGHFVSLHFAEYISFYFKMRLSEGIIFRQEGYYYCTVSEHIIRIVLVACTGARIPIRNYYYGHCCYEIQWYERTCAATACPLRSELTWVRRGMLHWKVGSRVTVSLLLPNFFFFVFFLFYYFSPLSSVHV